MDQDWGSIGGISESASAKVYDVFNALGTVAFAFSFADRLPKIQVSSSPPPDVHDLVTGIMFMWKLVSWGVANSRRQML